MEKKAIHSSRVAGARPPPNSATKVLTFSPAARAAARASLRGLADHAVKSCIGQMAEIFDAEPPFEPRGCIAQAWGTAEWLRALDRTSDARASGRERA